MRYTGRIVGAGSAFPERVMTNKEFEAFVDTNDEWIRTRTGIETRRIADPSKGENTLSMAHAAAKKALDQAGLDPKELDLILVGTITPNTVMPCTANQLQALLGAENAFGFDLQAACSGWVFGLSVAEQYFASGKVKNALVIGVETLSMLIDWQDRSTCVLFGDAAGATVLQRTEATPEGSGIIGINLGTDGRAQDLLCIPHGYCKVPPWSAEYSAKQHKIKMQGSEVFKLATRTMVKSATELLEQHETKLEEIDYFFFHQANIRIIDHCARALGVAREKMWINVDRYGNTSAATLPIALEEAWKSGAVKPGNLMLFATFGGGLTWGSALIRL